MTARYHKIRGDTLVEVLFATAVFSLVAVGALSIMNQGTNAAQRALEITMVRNEMDAQAETLRFINASYVGSYPSVSSTQSQQWLNIIAKKVPSAAVFSGGSACVVPAGAFILNARKAELDPTVPVPRPTLANTFSQVVYDSVSNDIISANGIWIEAVKSTNVVLDPSEAHIGYVDFHIRACWESPGQSIPVTLGTIVRLYAPK